MLSRPVILLSYLLLATTTASGAERLTVEVITPEAFCANLITSLVDSPLVAGAPKDRINMAISASGKLVRLMKTGVVAPILPLSQLGLTSRELEPEHPRYVSMTALLAEAIEENADLTLAFDVNELRYIPYSMQNTHVLLLVKDMHELTPERAKVVTHVAKRLNIKVSTIWYGAPAPGNDGPQTGLALLAAMTGGKFVDLNWIVTDCGSPAT